MRIANIVGMRLRALFRRDRVEEDLDEELRYHLERDTEENIRAGMTPEAARLQAIRSLEGIERRKEECRDAHGTRWLERLAVDVLYAWRLLLKHKMFSAVPVLILALAIGATRWTSKGQEPKAYQTPYGEVSVARHVYQTGEGGTTFCPLERDSRILLTSTPRFAKQVSNKYGEGPGARGNPERRPAGAADGPSRGRVEGGVVAAGGVPDYAETRAYIAQIRQWAVTYAPEV